MAVTWLDCNALSNLVLNAILWEQPSLICSQLLSVFTNLRSQAITVFHLNHLFKHRCVILDYMLWYGRSWVDMVSRVCLRSDKYSITFL